MSRASKKTLRGVCHLHSETGTEGGYWAFQDKRHIKKVNGRESWSYDGLHILNDGDKLTIYDKKDTSRIVWAGIIGLKLYPVFTQSAFNFWIHADQIGTPREIWARWFLDEYPAKLVKAPKKNLP